MLDVLIRRKHHVEPRGFSRVQKLAVFKLRTPLHFGEGVDFMF